VTTVSTVDPIKANFTVSEQEYLGFARRDTPMNRLELELILADDSVYPHKGKFAFADRQVSQDTGAIQLTGLFPNPRNILRPGQYGKVRAAIGTISGALLVPQPAVVEVQGSYQVAVVDGNNTVRIQPVKLGETVGTQWIISDGLKPGQRVVAEGVQKVTSGMRVNPRPFSASTDKTGAQ
jgi:membrane fusion protein (multidrug efflux system)